MRHLPWLLALSMFFSAAPGARAQITNLKVNGVSANFTVVQGDSLWWECDLPVGGTALGELWLDLNGNEIIDPPADKNVLGNFSTTDGQSWGSGPTDMDGALNGHIFVGTRNIGLAPAHYVLRFTNNGVSQQVTGTVAPLAPPAFTVSGTVTPPPGASPQDILVQAVNLDGWGQWYGLTDLAGNYTVNFNASMANARFRIGPADAFPSYIVGDTTLTLAGSHTGIDFVYARAAAQVVGYLKGEDARVLSSIRVRCYPFSGGNGKQFTTDANGYFQFGFALSEIASAPLWQLYSGEEGVSPDYFPPYSRPVFIQEHDSLRVDLTAFTADDSITGFITLDGHPPYHRPFSIYAESPDSGRTMTTSNPVTGAFKLHVTKHIHTYYPRLDPFLDMDPGTYSYDWDGVQLHPGDAGVVLDVQTVTWQPQASNTTADLRALSFVDVSRGWVAGANGTVLTTPDAGATWSHQSTYTSATINGICFVSPSTGWFVGNGGVIKKTINGGASWSSQSSTTTRDLMAVQFIDANQGWAVGGSTMAEGTILKTTNGGATWSAVPAYVYYPVSSIHMVDASTGWACGPYGLWKTTDGWASYAGQYAGLNDYLSVHFVDANTGWASGEGSACARTTNGGADWATQALGHWDRMNSVFCVSASRAWIAASNGHIYRTIDGGATWAHQATGSYSDLRAVRFVDENSGWAVGDNGTILHTTSGGAPVAVGDSPSAGPAGFMLSQNCPNPFRASTTFRFALPEAGTVSLVVYDVLGREVGTVAAGRYAAGSHRAVWDGGGAANGMYFARLAVRDGAGRIRCVKTTKLVLMK